MNYVVSTKVSPMPRMVPAWVHRLGIDALFNELHIIIFLWEKPLLGLELWSPDPEEADLPMSQALSLIFKGLVLNVVPFNKYFLSCEKKPALQSWNHFKTCLVSYYNTFISFHSTLENYFLFYPWFKDFFDGMLRHSFLSPSLQGRQ